MPVYKSKSKNDIQYYGTNQSGFASNFNNFLYAYIYAKKLKKSFYVYDLNNPISPNYHILKESFVNPSNIVYIDTYPDQPGAVSLSMIRALTLNLSKTVIQEEAKELFRLTPEITSQIRSELSKYTFPLFDIGVHIRSGDKIKTGEMAAIPIETYSKEINGAANKVGTTNVFVMTDNLELLEALKQKVNEGIHIYSLNQDKEIPCASGHNQGVFNLLPHTVKLNAYIQFMTELYLMQQIPNIICTFSSNIGRYLYITSPTTTNFKSLDMKVYLAL
jgi:hypothetical protein